MTDLAGWTIVSDDDNGSILVQSPQGHRRRIWRDETEEENATLLAKVNKQQAEIERLNNKINWWITTDEARKRVIAEKQAEIELLRKQVATS